MFLKNYNFIKINFLKKIDDKHKGKVKAKSINTAS